MALTTSGTTADVAHGFDGDMQAEGNEPGQSLDGQRPGQGQLERKGLFLSHGDRPRRHFDIAQ